MGGTCGTTEKKKYLQSFGRNIGRKEIAWKTHAQWEDNVKKKLKVMGREIVDWIDLAEDSDKWRAVVNTVMNVAVLENAGNFWNS